jgi:GTPase SAR1 family protein
MAELRCPYCWQECRQNQLLAHCPEHPGERDFYPASQKACPHGERPAGGRYCPHCRKPLEHDYITTKSRTIAVIGSRQSGKSTYVGVLIHDLQNRIGADFNGMATVLVGDRSRQRYREVFKGPMYDKGRMVDFTDGLRQRYSLDPLLFMLRFPRRTLLGDRLTAAMMVFYDTAGEDVLNAQRAEGLVDYLDAADGILFVVDPLQVGSVRRRVDDSVPLPVDESDQVAVVERIAELLRRRRNLPAQKKLDVPFAIALAKTDALDNALPPDAALRRAHNHRGAYDDADGQYVHDEVRATLSSWADGTRLLDLVDSTFSTHRFFGISALGFTPTDAGTISRRGIRPLRVEDPLLWLL